MSTRAIIQSPCKKKEWDNYDAYTHHLAVDLGMTNMEATVFAEILRQRYILSQEMPMAWVQKLILSPKVTDGIRAKYGMTTQYFQVIKSKLRKAGVIIGKDVNPQYILNVPINRETFNLLLTTRFS